MSESKAVAPVVSLTNNRPTTTSINVAEVFGKQHAHVIRDIEKLKDSCPADFHESNFGLMSQDVQVGNGATRKSPMYLLTRDGLTLLVMGYTGKEAMKFKLAYIEAFNRMEERLKAEASGPLPEGAPAKRVGELNPRQPLWDAMREWALRANLDRRTCRHRLCTALGVKSMTLLPVEREAEAVAWVRGEIAALNPAPREDAITADLCKRVAESLAGKSLDEQIAIRERVIAAMENARPLPPLRGTLSRGEGETMQLPGTEGAVDSHLKKALESLNKAFLHSNFLDKDGKCPVKGYRKPLYIACRCNIDAAGAIVRAMAAAENVPLGAL